ncbi:hypothetical protein NX059_000610 [Plenodomus lindquistii]|nr:hypothetical protein NX059_000610 [Plenodomus lindquistii]
MDAELKADIIHWIVVKAICAALEAVAVMLCCCFPTFPRFWMFLRQRGRDHRQTKSYELSKSGSGSQRAGIKMSGETSHRSATSTKVGYKPWSKGVGDVRDAKGESEEAMVGIAV